MPWQRDVFFFGGFDPRGPARDHRLCVQAVEQHPATAADETVSIGPRQRLSPHLDRWSLHWRQPDGTEVHTRHTVMRWDDIVRRVWPRHWRQAWADRLVVYLQAPRHGVLGPVWRHARAAFWLAMLPLGLGLGLLLPWLLLAATASTALGTGPWPWPVAVALWLWSWRALEVRLDADWLLRLYGFTWHQSRGEVPGLEQRLDELAEALVRCAEAGESREILVVGHSTGSQMAASVVARALARAPWLGQRGPELALLTLGHCTPLLAWVRQAEWFRGELARLAAHPHLTWHDISAPTDWAAFARVPPWLKAPRHGGARLAQYSPRFHKTLGRGDYDALLAHRHALHQQYLKAPRHAGGYDPVVWMSGPLTLAERHAAMQPPPPTP